MKEKMMVGIGLIILGGIVITNLNFRKKPVPVEPIRIETFEECAEAGYPVMESYPERCRTPDGRTFTRVTPEVTPSPITLNGTYMCLPKKDTGGPVTLECALGMQTENGYYALDLSNIPTENYPAIQTGQEITVEGTLLPQEMVSRDRWTTYDVTGIVAVDRIDL